MKALLEKLPEDLLQQLGKSPSALYICTSQPKWLLFASSSENPMFVVQIDQTNSLQEIFDTTYRLAAEMPSRIAEPIALITLDNYQSALVQRGLPGTPWFTLSNLTRHIEGWSSISKIAIETLSELHTAIRKHERWNKSVNLLEEFDRLSESLLDVKSPVVDSDIYDLTAWRNEVSSLDTVVAFAQHGDFCLNNLLIGETSASVLDFEQFAQVHIPLHDEFMLCDSLLSYYPQSTTTVSEEVWSKIIENSVYRDLALSDAISPLFLLHIMWWLKETDRNPLRASRALAYRRTLENLLNEGPKVEWRAELTKIV